MKRDKKIIILGAGIAGMSCSYHLGHQNCIVIDKNPYKGGHCYTHSKDESLWDEGPHVSFTKNKYVQNLLWSNNNCKFSEFNAEIGNWYKGNWIPHPAQYNLHSIPKSLAKECLDDFLLMRKSKNNNKQKILKNYEEWLINAFGEKFARNFPFTYTKKYWTCNPKDLTTNWIGERLVYPNPKDIIEGFQNKSRKSSHYPRYQQLHSLHF